MKTRTNAPLRLNRETVRDLTADQLAVAAGGQLTNGKICYTIPATFCACTGTETANTYCVC